VEAREQVEKQFRELADGGAEVVAHAIRAGALRGRRARVIV
jgi:hypothetical protein